MYKKSAACSKTRSAPTALSVMSKSFFVSFVRHGKCIMQEELSHFASLHFNVARIGFLRSGEKRIGDFKDAGQREEIGQILLQAIADFYGAAVLQSEAVASDSDVSEAPKRAHARLSAAKQVIEGMGDVFLVRDRAQTLCII